jgi:hypothetical protein
MGDRTTVYLNVLVSQADAAKKLFDYESQDEYPNGEQFIEFQFSEINHGTLDFLNKLQEAGIAFDSSWSPGLEYGAGTTFCRFTADGQVIKFDRYDSEAHPDLSCLMKRIDDPKALREYILEHYNNVTPLPWDNQEEYGKLYRTKQLINPS